MADLAFFGGAKDPTPTLIVTDAFTKHIWLRKLRNKTASEVCAKFEDILTETTPPRLQLIQLIDIFN